MFAPAQRRVSIGRARTIAFACVVCIAAAAIARQDRLPGWQLVVASGSDQSRIQAPGASFALEKGESLDPLVPAAGLVAGYTAQLAIESAGRYRFGIEEEGGTTRLQLFAAGSKRLAEIVNAGAAGPLFTEWVDLRAAPVTVSVVFRRAGDGPARLRTLWQKEGTGEQGFSVEAIPPGAAAVPEFAARDTARAQSERRGRVLLGQMNCGACHDTGPKGKALLPDRAAPLLAEAGARIEPAFLFQWVSDPQAIKPGCGMPAVLGDSQGRDAEDITQFLRSLSSSPPPLATGQGADEGRRLYHSIGCVACHGALESPAKVYAGQTGFADVTPDAPAPNPLGKIAGKWRQGALAAFLHDPLQSRPGSRMPSMSLTEGEAASISLYLVEHWGPSDGRDPPADTSRVAAGRAAFASRGCAACHQIGNGGAEVASTLRAKPLGQLAPDWGCLNADHGPWPRYVLTGQQRADLAAGIDAVKRAEAGPGVCPAPTDRAELAIATLGCANCHTRNEAGGLADAYKPYFQTVDGTELGDEGRLAPSLTGVGYKLRTSWLSKVLTQGGRARPYMTMRMPQFDRAQVAELPRCLAAQDGIVPDSDAPAPRTSDELLLAGRKLVGDTGMNCISCHTFAGRTAGTAGPETRELVERIRYEWFAGYILAPGRFKPGTRMQSFYKDGRGTVVDVLDGNPGAQTRALWAYLAARTAPSPEGLPSGDGMPVVIGDRPLIFRTFMKDAGNRGIAVGFPIGIHFGFDATAVRLVDAWQGEFIDATKVWKNRGGEVVTGQGKTVWTAPAGPALVLGARPQHWPDAAGCRFRGYTIEKDGMPTFRYSMGEGTVIVAEQFRPRPKAGVLIGRAFRINGLTPGATVWMNAGKGDAAIRSVQGATAEANRGPDGATWFGLAASANEVVFEVEIPP